MTSEANDVTQADRDAAAGLYAAFTVYADREERSAVFRRGEMDDSEFVQAFARHRIAAEARSHDGEWEVEYEVWQKDAFGPDCDGMVAGSCSLAEAQHYVAVYGQDSPAWLVEVRRRSLSAVPLFDEGREAGKLGA